MQKPRSPIVLRDVASYDVMVRTGPRLKVNGAEHGANRSLVPAEAYAPYWMTGGDILYVNCRQGYRREAEVFSAPGAGFCDVDVDCGVGGPGEGVTLKFQCTKK